MEYTLEELRKIKEERWMEALLLGIHPAAHFILDNLGRGVDFQERIYDFQNEEIKIRIANAIINGAYRTRIIVNNNTVYDEDRRLFKDGEWVLKFNTLECQAIEVAARKERLRKEAEIKELREELGL